MAAPKTWRVLTEGNAQEIVLAVDFDATGRAEGRFTDLAKGLDDSRLTVWETIPQAADSGIGADGDPYIDTWLEEVRADGRTVRAVFGFCVGAVYAGAIAERVAGWQGQAPTLVLFDPEQSSPLTLYSQFHKVIDSMAAILDPEEIAEAKSAGERAHAENPGMTALGAELLAVYRRTAKPAFERLELDEKRTEELTAVFASFVAYLTAAALVDPLPAWRKAIAVSSSSPTSGLNGARAARPDEEITVAREIRAAAPHVDLLRDHDVTRTVSGLLSEFSRD